MITYTVVGLVDDVTGELFVAGVFEGQHRNADRHPDTEGPRRVLDRFTGYFDADDADQAEEMAREVVGYTTPPPKDTRTGKRPRRVTTAQVKGSVL